MGGRWTTVSDVRPFLPPFLPFHIYFSTSFRKRDRDNYITTDASPSLSASFAHLSSNISFMSGLSVFVVV